MTSRRRFLKILPYSAAIALLPGCKDGSRIPHTARRLLLGPLSSFSSAVTYRALERVAILRDSAGLAAISLICTHQTCMLRESHSADAGHFVCPCHGSEFNTAGEVLKGPAVMPLPFYELSLNDARELELNLDKQVTAHWRLPV